jgi:glycosyltransferase involved in cell wall biosynthesis
MSAPSEPLVSVVTPVYNEERYLPTCIESVLSQDYGNWEYLIVNNASTDRSLEIAREYSARDARIRVHDNESFLQQVPNLNHALRQISPDSKYCKMLLGDDWLFPECLARMVQVAEAHPSVGIVGSYRLDDRRVTCDGLPYPSIVISGRDARRLWFLEELFVFGSPTSLLFRAEIVRSRDPFYSEGRLHEDTEACYEILEHHDFGFVHQVLTFTRRENESISSRLRKFDQAHLLDKLLVLRKYGPGCLDEEEYVDCLRAVETRYYSFLGSRVLTHPNKLGFLRYHREGLRSAGARLHRARVVRHSIGAVLDLALNPKLACERLVDRLRRSRRRRR